MESADALNNTTASSEQTNFPAGQETSVMSEQLIEMPRGEGKFGELDATMPSLVSVNGAPNGRTSTSAEQNNVMPRSDVEFMKPKMMTAMKYGSGIPEDRAKGTDEGKREIMIKSAIDTVNVGTLPTEWKIEILWPESALWWPECCIYEVPQSLKKEENALVYAPQFVSIGPIHHKNQNLKTMENHKKIYSTCFQRRLHDYNAPMDTYRAFLERQEEYIRLCYSKKFEEDRKEFVNMIILDAVFIMELFLRRVNNLEPGTDLLFTKPWIMSGVKKDLLLLENQLPMFVLVELYNNFVPDFLKGKEHYSFHELAYKYFFNPNQDPLKLRRVYQDSKHFTDMLRFTKLPCDFQQLKESKTECFHLLKTAIKLDEAGITIEKHKHDQGIKFENKGFLSIFPFLSMIPGINCFKARFMIPPLNVDERTEIHFKNIVALEQCHYPCEQYISSYIALLDRLVDTREDVHFLLDKKIINHTMGSNKEVACFFNNLLKDVCISSEFYGDEIERMHEHCENPWNIGMAKLKSVYFCNLWRGSLTVLGIVVFFFSIFNSIYAFTGYI